LTCIKRCLLDSHHDPHCINCRKEWSNEFVKSSFPSSWLNQEYRKNREIVLFEREKTFLPNYQELAQHKKILDEVEKEFVLIKKEERVNEENEEQLVREQKEKRVEIKSRLVIVETNMNKMKREERIISIKEKKISVVMKCIKEDCRGFLSDNYKCGICEISVCKDCHTQKEEEHKCDPNEVATVMELKKTTRPCPSCHTPIFKIDGCDQMFCTKCHTAFSWNTGQVEKGVIHNPHYFQALREGNIQVVRHREHQGECGPIPSYYRIIGMMKGNIYSVELEKYYQSIVHHRNVTLLMYLNGIHENEEDDRVKYLAGLLEEKKFKQKVYVRKEKEKIYQIEKELIRMYVTIGEELFRSMSKENIEETYKQLEEIKRITNEELKRLRESFVHKGIVKNV